MSGQSDCTFAVELDMVNPDELHAMLKAHPGISAAYVNTPHWDCYRFVGPGEKLQPFIMQYWDIDIDDPEISIELVEYTS